VLRLAFDVEADSLTPKHLWCICAKDVDTDRRYRWTHEDGYDTFKVFAKTVDMWIPHNGMSFDVPVVNRLLGEQVIDPQKVIDTFVISRLVNYPGYKTHSLDEIGTSLGSPKTVFNDWSNPGPVMYDYCDDDVGITVKIFKKYRKYIEDPKWQASIRCEHDIVLVCNEMHDNGFYFNSTMAQRLLNDVERRMGLLEQRFQEVWPPELKQTGSIKYRVKKDGYLFSNVSDAMRNYPKTKIVAGDLLLYTYVGFNPGSSKDRVDKLWDSGWQPFEKSDGHYKFGMKAGPGQMWGKTKLTKDTYEEKKKYFAHYGWTVNEENLQTLPDNAPEGASALAEWLTLNGRKTALTERLNATHSDFRIRAKFWHIGAWTHRMAHSSPNLANISSPFPDKKEPKNAVEEVKKLYDAEMREMFGVDRGYLLGTDAESIQLRILAHYLKNQDYVDAIVAGRKEDASDIHNVNRRALGLDDITRDHAKTFIYAWLLGAGSGKVSRILGCSLQRAKEAVQSFINSVEGLSQLKSGRILRDAGRGYFEGLDGRKVIQNDAYYMLAGYLQNGEAIVMKHANLLWREWADREKIKYMQVNFVHDEWQTQVLDSMDATQRLGWLQCESLTEVGKRLKVFCPLSGESRIGYNWLETH
jgi:DNA polymerase-1